MYAIPCRMREDTKIRSYNISSPGSSPRVEVDFEVVLFVPRHAGQAEKRV